MKEIAQPNFICTILVVIQTLRLCDCKTRLWEKDPCLERQRKRGVVSLSTTTKVFMQCAAMCSQKSSCVIIAFNNTSGSCLGYSRIATSKDDPSKTKIIAPNVYIRVILLGDSQNTKLIIHKEERDYATSSAICNYHCARHLILDVEEKQKKAFSHTALRDRNYGIGLNDISREGKWVWENGRPFNRKSKLYDYTFNNFQGSGPASLRRNCDCGRVNFKTKSFFDGHCKYPVSFVCERL